MVDFHGLDFKFKVKSLAGIYTDFSVSVLGLSASTITDLTVWNPVEAIKKPRRIIVYAGYAKTGEEVIASGYIWYATPTPPPEMWMNFECKQFLGYSDRIEKPYTLKNKYMREIFTTIAAECGYRGDYRTSDNKLVSSFTIEGKKGELARTFAYRFGKKVCLWSNILICEDNDGERRNPEKKVLVSQDTGLLSIGQIDIIGARITTRLRADIKIFDWIELQSTLIPSSNGPYFVIEEETEGHFRGEVWQTTYRCLRKV
jgi:hypothetical protein